MPADSLPPDFFNELKTEFDPSFYSTDPDDLKNFGKDWTRVYEPDASLDFFPRNTAQVSSFLKLCSKHKVAVVPSGGRTGLAGGAVASNGEVVLSFDKMRETGKVDLLAHTLWVQAGAITEAVHDLCKPELLQPPASPAIDCARPPSG